MSKEFEAIETQEAFDNAIRDRLDRNTKKVEAETAKKYEGYISPDDFNAKTKEFIDQIAKLTKDAEAHAATIADLTAKNKAYETSSLRMKIAHECGIPYELSQRLSGETEDEIRKDAQALSKFVTGGKNTPKVSSEQPTGSAKNDAYRQLLHNLKGEV